MSLIGLITTLLIRLHTTPQISSLYTRDYALDRGKINPLMRQVLDATQG